jgi:RNA polymerase sigma factor (sigma-70 family)
MNVTDEDERELTEWMRGAQDGDRDAYDKLLRKAALIVRSAVRRKRRFLQAADVEDIVQDTLLSLHSVRASYDPKRPFMPWLMAIAGNRMADAARRHLRKANIEANAADFTETFSAAEMKDLERGIEIEKLTHAVTALPPVQRAAFEMLKLRGLTLREASQASGLSIVALKVAVHRAMHALRRTLQEKS